MRYLPTPPKEFSSDGVSGLISALYRRIYGKEIPWVECAVRHDWVYYHGGPEHLRSQADKAVAKCVADHGHPILSIIVWAGVRIGGVWWVPYKTARWAYGYPFPERGPQDSDYATPPITDAALNVHIRDEITGKEV